MAFAQHTAVTGTKTWGPCRGMVQNGKCNVPRSRRFQNSAPSQTRCQRPHMTATGTETEAETETVQWLQQFIADAGDLGTIRFVAVSDGAVLETIGRFDYSKKVFSIPGRGAFLTLANLDKTFECHLNMAKVNQVTMSKEKAKVGEHDLYVIRFLRKDGGIALSCLLMWDPSQGPGFYLHGAVDAFEALRKKYNM